jgi:hypothetical protein
MKTDAKDILCFIGEAGIRNNKFKNEVEVMCENILKYQKKPSVKRT